MLTLKALISWVRSLFAKPDLTHPSDIPAVILIGTNYDRFTEYAVEWLQAVFDKSKLRCRNTIQLNEKDLSKGHVRTAMASVDLPGRIEVFCGHGNYDALLGPPSNGGDVTVNGVEHSVIYDTTMVPKKPSSLVAFSCRSAEILGRAYATYMEKGFIGFNNDLPLDFSPIFMLHLKTIFLSIVADVLAEGRVGPNHQRILENYYDQSISFFMDGDGRKVPDSFVFQLFLVEHRRGIRLYSTHLL